MVLPLTSCVTLLLSLSGPSVLICKIKVVITKMTYYYEEPSSSQKATTSAIRSPTRSTSYFRKIPHWNPNSHGA